ncbi:MAG: EAL domain-containing protein [Candidatus Palauibacterales bacterium]|nr:EAL domain-containing protein [Candidatus Palauibacterales bacterium]
MTEPVRTFVARQPIFDADEELRGYELLYRGDAGSRAAEEANPEQMTSDVIVNSVVTFGLEELTRGAPAFINMSEDMIMDGTVRLVEPDGWVVELLESVPPDSETVRRCRVLAANGYCFALDDFTYRPELEPLLEVADYVKIDVLDRGEAEIADDVEAAASHDVQLVAERVESPSLRERAEELGFDLFQGNFFREPETVSGSELPVKQVQLFRLLNLLRDFDVADAEVEEVFRSAPSLTYKLLRIVNSAGVGGRGVNSIGHAIRMLGRQRLHRWMSLLLVSSVTGEQGVDREAAKTAIQRGRFLELLAREAAFDQDASALFLLGVFSLLDSLLDEPMERVAEQLDLREDVRWALLYDSGPLAAPLRLARRYESGSWEQVFDVLDQVDVSLDPEDLTRLYFDSLAWARERLASAGAAA